MLEVQSYPDAWMPATADDRRAIRAELERMLASPLFRNSKRYPNLLRYLVEQTLAGNENQLKERLLGVAVFHRPADYDTNQDTVVRLAAGEVRKRIAQFYHEGPPTEVQIDLRPGCYIPLFQPVEPSGPGLGSAPAGRKKLVSTAVSLARQIGERSWQTTAGRPKLLLAGLAALLAVGAAAFFLWQAQRNSLAADHQLWDPIIDEPGPVRLVVADISAGPPNQPAVDPHHPDRLYSLLRLGEIVNYRDSNAVAGIAAYLARRGESYTSELSTQATYPDLQSGASVLIGGLDNVWTQRVTASLRYRLVSRDIPEVVAIEDRLHPGRNDWRFDFSQPNDRIVEDFAIVARIFDQTTGRPVLVVAGLGANGTAAAAEFLLDPARTAELTPHAPRNWRRMNMEAVIRTQIIGNHAGPPHLVTCSFW